MQIFPFLVLGLLIFLGVLQFFTGYRADSAKRPFFISHQLEMVGLSLIVLTVILNFIAYLVIYENISTPLMFLQFLGAGSVLFIFYGALEWIANIFFVIISLALIGETNPSLAMFAIFLRPSSFSLPAVMGCVAFVAYLGFQLRTYSIYGVISKSLLPAVGAVLTKLNQEYDQREGVGFYIKSLKAILIVKLNDEAKMVSLKFKWNSLEKIELLNQIIHELKHYYQDEDSELTTKTLGSFLVGGVILFILGIVGFFLMTNLNGQLNP